MSNVRSLDSKAKLQNCKIYDTQVKNISDFRLMNWRLQKNLSITDGTVYSKVLVQLNKYETAPNFNHISQNLTSDCLLI